MRSIEFRGKRIGNGEWVYGTPIIYKSGDVAMEAPFQYVRVVDPETVGQFTGLYDKNGTKIFEGDILDTTNSNCRIWYVDYKKTSFCANQTNCNFSIALEEFMIYSVVEVVGNIYDNPELLEGENNNE